MSRLLLPLRRLRWQLTLSYILITLVAALTLEVASATATVVAPPKTPMATPAEILANAMYFTEAQQIVPYLEQNPPDQHGLAVWANIWAPRFTFSKLGFVAPNDGAAASSGQVPIGSIGARDVTVVIVGTDGRVLASSSAATPSLLSVGALVVSPRAQAVLRAALTTGKVNFQQSILADGRTVVAVPVAAYDGGPVLGALLVAATLAAGPEPQSPGPLPIADILGALKAVLPNALVLVILASVVGTLFGVLTSRRITRRLRHITLAADAWSRGEFQTTVRDGGRDELGQLAADLNLMAEQLQRLLAARQELAVVEERHRLARDLHDSVKQQLFAVTMLVGSARLDVQGLPETERTLRDAEQIARRAQQELTGLIRALRPLALADKGLSAAVRDLCDDWSQRTGIPTSIQAPIELSLPPTTEQELYRVIEEALSNIARHSWATRAEVSIVMEQETAILRIEDNGRGFAADEVERRDRAENQDGTEHDRWGMGLRSMRERVEGVGGAFQIASGAEGTRVEIRVPLVTLIEPVVQSPAPATLALAAPNEAET
jgi:two-component system, NarL family, sensor histidine kinase LiaS